MKLAFHLALLSAIVIPAAAQQPVGEVFASDVSVRGSIVVASGGTRVLSGSHIEAGETAALLRLTRGGQVRICPKTGLAVSSSATSPEILFGMNTGSVELNYRVGPFADSVVTPDFRLQLAGPGGFHVAIGSRANGDTCIRSLPGNSASVIVTEMMGDGTYQVRAADSVTFRAGKLASAVEGAGDCGCPEPPPPPPVEVAPAPMPELPAMPPPNLSAETHVELDAPLVYHADSEQRAQDIAVIARLHNERDNSLALKLEPRGEAQVAKPRKKSVFARLGSFFTKMFR